LFCFVSATILVNKDEYIREVIRTRYLNVALAVQPDQNSSQRELSTYGTRYLSMWLISPAYIIVFKRSIEKVDLSPFCSVT